MTPEEVLALLVTIARLQATIIELEQEIAALRQQVNT